MLPETVKIGPLTYRVRMVDDLHDGAQELLGWHRLCECEISVRTGMSDALTLSVFWHEVLHALLESAGQEQSEALCDALSYGLVGMFEANGWSIQL